MTAETLNSDTETTTETTYRGRVPDRDFTKPSEMHNDLAKYVNANSGLTLISGKHVKAVLALRGEFVKSSEHQAKLAQRKEELVAEREQREAEKEQREAEKAEREAQYAGMTDDQVKAVQKAERLAQKAADAHAEARRLLGYQA